MPERVVFVSSGQLTKSEVQLGRDVAAVIESHKMRPFFAQDVHSASDLNSEVFRAIQTCDAFLAILQKRGLVKFAEYPPMERSSVWIQQEIAMFCYRMFLERRSLPIRAYSERGIRLEGVMGIAVVNPIEFDRPEEIPAEVGKWLDSREFEEHPVLARREGLFARRLAGTNQDERLLLELIAAHCTAADDFALHAYVRDDFFGVLRVEKMPDDQIEKRFREAYERLKGFGLVREEASRSTGEVRIWISKQWFQLLLDELRREGRRL